MEKKDGGPAFPSAGGLIYGMTLRDYFAGIALRGIFQSGPDNVTTMDCPERARYAYMQADAMLAEREK
jgi:hypothetical protein